MPAMFSTLASGCFAFVLPLALPILGRGLRREEGADNLCIDGQLAPEFFLLGTQCAGTTSFALELEAHPSIFFPENLKQERDKEGYFHKELHIFDNANQDEQGKGRFFYGRDFWLRHYPSCKGKAGANRSVAVDATPNYFFIPGVYENMIKFYGNRIHKVNFAVTIREPLARMHSAFWFYKGKGAVDGDFKTYIDKFVAEFGNYTGSVYDYVAMLEKDYPGELSKPLAVSLYPPQFSRYFDSMRADRLTVIPIGFLTHQKQNQPKVANAIFTDVLRLPALKVEETYWHPGTPKGHLGKPFPDRNMLTHPSIEQDLDAVTLRRAENLVARLTGPLACAEVLAAQNSVNLYGYSEHLQNVGTDLRDTEEEYSLTLGGRTQTVAAWLGHNW